VRDSEIREHIELIRSLSKPGKPLTADAPTATINNPEWFVRRAVAPARRNLWNKILRTNLATSGNVEIGHKAILLAGPPGAGKSTVVSHLASALTAGFLTIDADVFKIALLDEALSDGSYESFIKPDAVKEYEQSGQKFFPMELSALVHAESSMIAQEQRLQALQEGNNVIIDTILSDEDVARRLVAQLVGQGYSIHLIDVEASYEVSHERVTKRWIQAYKEALDGAVTLGGRWVPSEYIRGIFKTEDGKAVSEGIARMIADECPSVEKYQVYRVLDVDAEAELEFEWHRP